MDELFWVCGWVCCGFVVLVMAVAVGEALGLGLGYRGGRMRLGWGVCGVLVVVVGDLLLPLWVC